MLWFYFWFFLVSSHFLPLPLSLSLSLSHLTYFCNLICNTRTKNITRLICVRFVVAAAAAGGGAGVGAKGATKSSNNKCTQNCSASLAAAASWRPIRALLGALVNTLTPTPTHSHTHTSTHTHTKTGSGPRASHSGLAFVLIIISSKSFTTFPILEVVKKNTTKTRKPNCKISSSLFVIRSGRERQQLAASEILRMREKFFRFLVSFRVRFVSSLWFGSSFSSPKSRNAAAVLPTWLVSRQNWLVSIVPWRDESKNSGKSSFFLYTLRFVFYLYFNFNLKQIFDTVYILFFIYLAFFRRSTVAARLKACNIKSQ